MSSSENKKVPGSSTPSEENETKKPNETKKSSHFKLFVATIIINLIAIGIIVYYIVELESTKKSITIASNKPAGEFAIEPSASVSSGILHECTYNGLKNQACVYQAQNLNEAINQCNRLPQVCNRFVYNSETKSMSFIGINSNNFVQSQNSYIVTRQVGITYSGNGPTNNTNSGGFSNTASFAPGGQAATTSGTNTTTPQSVAGTVSVSPSY